MALVVGGTTVTGTQVLDATKLSGNLPALNGSSLTNLTAGKVLQVQSANFTSSSAHNSETYSASNYTDQITPSATNSKILVQFQFRSHIYQGGDTESQSLLAVFRQINGGGYSQLYPNSTSASWGMSVSDGERGFWCTPQINYLDTTHNTTNAIDYKIYGRRRLSSSGSVNIGGSSHQAQVVLMEIAA